MSPIQQVHQLYFAKYGMEWSCHFECDLESHFRHGHVFSSPEFFMMGFPVLMKFVHSCLIRDLPITTKDNVGRHGDCWFVWCAAGDVRKALSFIPYPLEYVAFARRGRLRVWRFDELTKRLAGLRK